MQAKTLPSNLNGPDSAAPQTPANSAASVVLPNLQETGPAHAAQRIPASSAGIVVRPDRKAIQNPIGNDGIFILITSGNQHSI